MSAEERKIYDMVVRRFMAVLLPPGESEEITVKAEAAGETFVTRGSVEKVPGWREAYDAGSCRFGRRRGYGRERNESLQRLRLCFLHGKKTAGSV